MKYSSTICKWLLLVPPFFVLPFLAYQAVNPALYNTSVLFPIGIEALPRGVVLLLSNICVSTSNEYLFLIGILLYLCMIDVAFALRNKLSKPTKNVALIICAIEISSEIIFRLCSNSYINSIAEATHRCIAIGIYSTILVLVVVRMIQMKQKDRSL